MPCIDEKEVSPDLKKPRLGIQETSVHGHIAKVNGSAWHERYQKICALIQPDVLRQCITEGPSDITGYDVYAKPDEESSQTRYDVVLNWQCNYLHLTCDVDGRLVKAEEEIATDESMMRGFYVGKTGKALDIGCNTGANMKYAIKHSKDQVDAYGIEFSPDSVALAVKALGSDHAFQGDASADYVIEHGWEGKFKYAHCTFVLQHMPPQSVDAALNNIAKCLVLGGEFLTTFKDAPTKDQLAKNGMSAWAAEMFTADLADKDAYIKDGYLHTIIWDDDYYPGVTSPSPPAERDLKVPGPHRRELYFYSLAWIKRHAEKYGLFAKEVGVVSDAKMPFSVFSWKVVFTKKEVS